DVATDAAHIHFGYAVGFVHHFNNPARNRKAHRSRPPLTQFNQRVGHDRLAERNPPVVGRYATVSEDLEVGGFEQPYRPIQQQQVLKDAARRATRSSPRSALIRRATSRIRPATALWNFAAITGAGTRRTRSATMSQITGDALMITPE